jgi:hypothetical protein
MQVPAGSRSLYSSLQLATQTTRFNRGQAPYLAASFNTIPITISAVTTRPQRKVVNQ